MQGLFGIDPRSLALFRMAIGAVLLLDLAIRASDLGAMYTDEGMFSRVDICRRYTTVWNWSFHFGGGSWAYQAMLFALAAGLAVALVIGFETRLAVIGSWLMLVSLQNRVPPILNGGDGLLRMLLFWSMFLPLGCRWSVDRWRETRRGEGGIGSEDEPVVSAATAAILLQMALMYFFSAAFKSNVTWMRGEVIAGTLAHDFYAKPLGTFFLQFPTLLTVLTVGIFVLEWLGPLLLFSPGYTARIRLWVVAALVAMHLCIQATLTVGLFSLISIAGLLLFLPRRFWTSRWVGQFAKAAVPEGSGAARGSPVAVAISPWHARSQWLCLGLLVYVLGVNINSLPGHPLSFQPPAKSSFLRTACGLGQKWNMFDEVPSKDGWYVAWARLEDGSEVDLLRSGAVVDWNRPGYPAGTYPNHRWRKCFREMAYFDQLGYQVFRVPVARYLCRQWNDRSPADKQVAEFDFIYCMETSDKVGDSTVQVTSRERLINLNWNVSEGDRSASSGI